jgi:hypothetical protein
VTDSPQDPWNLTAIIRFAKQELLCSSHMLA